MGPRTVVLMMLLAATPLSAQTRWHATAAAPRAGLPDVEVDLGYTDLYLPLSNAPVTLRARSGERPFDGYLGYHTAVGDRQVFEIPVIARAELRPHSQWTFSTTVQLYRGMRLGDYSIGNRELVIEWRDRDRNVLAQRSIGVPPWTESSQPLRIVRSGEASSASCFGQKAVLLPASSLSDQAQWYGGFSMIVVPVSLWLELPRSTRDAIFHSAVRVVFIGIPDRVPENAIDRALLPIELHLESPARISWRAKSGAHAIGSAESPRFVTNEATMFVAEEQALLHPLPAFEVRPGPLFRKTRRPAPSAGEILRDYRPAILFTLFAALSIAAWLWMRRRPRAFMYLAMVAVTLLAIGWRNSVRLATGQRTDERISIAAPGIIDVQTIHTDTGPAARGVSAGGEGGRTLYASAREGNDMEVRTSRTVPGFGELHFPGRPWATMRRETVRRDLGTPATFRVRSQDAQKLVLEYDSALRADYVAAAWVWNGRMRYGEARTGSRRGTATIRHADLVSQPLPRRSNWPFEMQMVDTMPGVSLMHVERDRTVLIQQPLSSASLQTRRTHR